MKNTLKKISKTAGLRRAKKDLEKLPLVTKIIPRQNVKSVSVKQPPSTNAITGNTLKSHPLSHLRVEKIRKNPNRRKKHQKKIGNLYSPL